MVNSNVTTLILQHLWHYTLALMFVAAGFLLCFIIPEVMLPRPFLAFWPVVVLAAEFGGKGPGVLATVASTLCVYFIISPHYGGLNLHDWIGLTAMGIFFTGGLAISVFIGEKLRIQSLQRLQAAEVAKNETLLRSVTDNVSIGIVTLDRNRQYRFVNPAYVRILGLFQSAEELIGRSPSEVLSSIYATQITPRLDQAFAGEKVTYELMLPLTPEGQPRHYAVIYEPIYVGREIDGVNVIIYDITASKQAEAVLRESEQDFRTLAEAMPQIVWATRPDGWNIYFNQQWVDYTGLTLEESYGHGWKKPFHPDDQQRAWDAWQQATQNNATYSLECRLRRADGIYHWWLIRGVPLCNADGKILKWFGTCTNIEDIKQTEVTLRESEARFRTLFEQAAVGVAEIETATGRFTRINKRYCDIVGYSREEMLSLDFQSITHPDDLQADLDNMRRLVSGEIREFTMDKRYFRKDRSIVWVSLTVSPMWLPGESPEHHISIVEDVSARKQAEEELQLAALVYRNSSEAMMVVDANNHIVAVNPAFTEMTGYSVEEAIGRDPKFLSSGQQTPAFYQAMWQAINTTGQWEGEIRNRRKSGELYVEWLIINTIHAEDGSVHRRVALFSDITEKKQIEQLIWTQANFDPLTDLPNRRMFQDRLQQEIRKAHRANLPLALMFLDLDRFKEVNDTLGHNLGDLLLKEAAQRLVHCVRETDTVARLGGDEFIIILTELDKLDSTERVAQDILNKLTAPYQLDNEVVYVSASIGITLFPDDATEIDALLKNADQAMYAAKNAGRSQFCYFTQAMQDAAQARMRLTNDLRGALANNDLMVYYQPIVDLETGNIQKAEALIRWQHPTDGLISPAEFIPIAEDTGLIVEIGDWVFQESARQVARWRAMHHAEFQISINKSPVQFHRDSDLQHHNTWLNYLKQLDLPGQSVVVEITEGLLLDASYTVTEQLLSYQNSGIQVSLDDFGTGYSSLSYLKKFDIDYLKIDQSFIRNLSVDSNDMALCEAIIVMAHKLGIKVIAEGVETAEQRDLLIAANCDYGQGYLFSKPVPAGEFEKLLQVS